MNIEEYMQRAISLAETYRYTAKPNPMVGAILLKDKTIIAEGAHELFGSNHAEVNVIESAKKKLGEKFKSFTELTLICTLEPCNHRGKTPPCTEAIINSGIKKVIIGCQDPNSRMAGKSIKKLIENNIDVKVGFCENDIKEQNKFFFYKHNNQKPYLTVKIASSSDGKSHYRNKDRTYITSASSREDVQKLRAQYDAILTGGNTLTNDNPRMNARVNFEINQPKKILLSNKNNLDINQQFFQDSQVEIVKEKNLETVINNYKNKDYCSILIEAGPKLVNAFLSTNLVDEVIVYQSPHPLGANGVDWFNKDITVESLGFNLESSYKIDDDTKKIFLKC
ncbi:MAG: bifunctional diaminohydroxyphosphoribosylaminopyrimidine deaminase/5-amino-6-(5-phosphoribosylamino)uracil reductase RibD [SAR86 cluster bacterium]|uniref:Riboflavin biosynthesis protein RibD n=1 Tax=SAR86 cluster bacterium TaxID=2030880 RepID=A0A520MCT4_9GAMM|nr:MAG: bifunctional diaminohydroxyphosphoribosylaminopyrimidine deaminase/5-amino-6-(5-phosphoribosylamino)uracil reductase RibD [SAR86 cluster bacterium]